jgi:hypothetical protein
MYLQNKWERYSIKCISFRIFFKEQPDVLHLKSVDCALLWVPYYSQHITTDRNHDTHLIFGYSFTKFRKYFESYTIITRRIKSPYSKLSSTKTVVSVKVRKLIQFNCYCINNVFLLTYSLSIYIYICIYIYIIHQGLVLRPSRVPKKVGINKKGVNRKWYSHKKKWT